MSVLAALARAYDRMAERQEIPAIGYSSQRIGYLVLLLENGSPAQAPICLLESGSSKRAPLEVVPQPAKRTRDLAPNFLWDKTSYALGVSKRQSKRTAKEHAAFVSFHEWALAGTDDAGLAALLSFLRRWKPGDFHTFGWPEEMKDQNVVFALESDLPHNIRLHDRPAARVVWSGITARESTNKGVCLVTGERAPIARIHPAIKGVWGAQTSGSSIVSFNLDAFDSYGHERGYNSPVSERIAFAYTTALNKFLEPGSRNRLQIGEASMVFWAEGSGFELAEAVFRGILGGEIASDLEQDNWTRAETVLAGLLEGRPLGQVAPELTDNVRLYVLGLAPNASRLSVGFWLEENFQAIVEEYRRFADEMSVNPSSDDDSLTLRRCLLETAAMGKREHLPPSLASDFLWAVLTGSSYPLTLLSTLLMRLRADKSISTLRLAMLKAVLTRNFKMETPMALDAEFKDKGYLLGRLFAVYEQIQIAALGYNVNATFKDRFYASASSRPRKMFHLMASGSTNALALIGKQKPGYRVALEKSIGAIMDMMSPADDPFPSFLSSKQQVLFGLGYHHQRNTFRISRSMASADVEGNIQ
jgi:CRISPR-associated protein Csd1